MRRRRQSVSQSVSRVVFMQSRRRVQGSRAADSDHWTFDCVCALLRVAASAVGAHGPWRRASSPCRIRAGQRGPQLTGTPCLSLLFKGEPSDSPRTLPKRSSHSPLFTTIHFRCCTFCELLAFQTAGGDVEPLAVCVCVCAVDVRLLISPVFRPSSRSNS